ncbi:MAG: hypothetical protein AB7V42_16115 [Thermoleophilia bacterium]
MGRNNDQLVLLDAFAGPGRYDDDQPGPALIMLSALTGQQKDGILA